MSGWRRRWLAAAAVAHWTVTASLAAAAEAAPLRDGALHRALHGLWCNSDDGGQRCWAWDEFLPDGRLRACGLAEGDPRPFFGEAVVRVDGQRLCYRVTAASRNFWLPVGARYCTDIIDIGPSHHRYRDLDTGAEFTLLRRAAPGAKGGANTDPSTDTNTDPNTAPHCPGPPDGPRP